LSGRAARESVTCAQKNAQYFFSCANMPGKSLKLEYNQAAAGLSSRSANH
jgi:hypothetical protein